MSTIHGMKLIDFELAVANKYKGKVANAKQRGVEFTLTLAQFRNILIRKRCAYTGRLMTLHLEGNPKNSDLTVERIDSEKGYVHGNVIAVCSAANSVKGVLEDPNTYLSVEDGIRMFANIERLQKGQKVVDN